MPIKAQKPEEFLGNLLQLIEIANLEIVSHEEWKETTATGLEPGRK